MIKSNRFIRMILCMGIFVIFVTAAPAGDYIGSEKCGMCHSDKFDSWSETPHADAYTLLEETYTTEVEGCLACHTTGMGSDAHDLAVSCEVCHGPGSDHFAGGGDTAAINMDIGEDTCLKCHTDEWSPDFNYEEYLKNGIHE